MKGLGRTIFGAIAIALPLMCTTSGATDEYDCSDCPHMSPAEFRHALDRLRKAGPLHVDVFTSFVYNRPVAIPFRAIEGGSKCTLTTRDEVEKFVAMMSDVKLFVTEPGAINPVAELKFYRADTGPRRPVMEAIFGDGGPLISAIINGHQAIVRDEQVQKILDAAAKVTRPPGNKVCESFRED